MRVVVDEDFPAWVTVLPVPPTAPDGPVVLVADQELLDPIWYRLTLPFVACGVAAATVGAWFHGEKGKQQTSVLEWMLLSVIGVIWLTLSAGIWVAR